MRHLSSCKTLLATGALPTPRPWRARTVNWRAARQRGPEEKKTPAGRTRPVVSGPGAGSQRSLRPPKPPAPPPAGVAGPVLVCPAPVALGLPRGHPRAPPGPHGSTHHAAAPAAPRPPHTPTPAPVDELEDGNWGPASQLLPGAHQGLLHCLVAGQHHRLLVPKVHGEHWPVLFGELVGMGRAHPLPHPGPWGALTPHQPLLSLPLPCPFCRWAD